MRQRVLAEAAVHAITGDADQPVVVSTPQLWDPGAAWPSAAFFSGLEVPWLSMADLPSAVSTTSGAERTYDGPLAYPRRQKEQELPVDNLLASEELNDTGRVFASLLARNDTVDDALAETAMLASATRARTARGRRCRWPVGPRTGCTTGSSGSASTAPSVPS